MVRKSKRTGGHLPLTHHERTKKLVKDYGTAAVRLAGHAQYQFGSCALCQAPFEPNHDDDNDDRVGGGDEANDTATTTAAAAAAAVTATALCTPSGYLYEPQAILEYMLQQKRDIDKQRRAYDEQQQQQERQKRKRDDEEVDEENPLLTGRKPRSGISSTTDTTTSSSTALVPVTATTASIPAGNRNSSSSNNNNKKEKRKKLASAHDSLRQLQQDKDDLKRTSYWLADSQPVAAAAPVQEPPDRPESPISQQPLRRKDILSVSLQFEEEEEDNNGQRRQGQGQGRVRRRRQLICAVSSKVITNQAATAYWTDKTKPGTVVLTHVYNELIDVASDKDKDKNKNKSSSSSRSRRRCPLTNEKIRHTRALQQSGSSFAASAQAVEVRQYRPTMT